MFQKAEIKRILPLLLFFLLYTLLFFLWVKTFFYTLPFLLGFLIAVAVQPLILFLDKKLRWNHTLSTTAVTILTLAAVFGVLTFLGIFAVQEITAFIVKFSNGGFTEFSEPVTRFLERAGSFFGEFDLGFLEQNQQEIMDLLKDSMDLILSFLGTVLAVVTSLPTVITMFLVVMFSTFFISRDMKKLRAWGKRILSESTVFHVKSAAENSSSAGRKYLLSYLLIYFITFCETYVIMAVLNVPYPLTISIITSVADVLPVLGPGIVFTPLAVYQLLIGQYPRAFGILIGWLVITCIRQVVEPKLVASTAKVHPLAMLAAIYFSLVGQSIWILFYVMGFFMLYSTFRETGALPSLTAPEEKTKARDCG